MITQSGRRWGWKLGLVSGLAMSGAIASSVNCTLAQITPDGTLPNNSIVTPNGSTLNITGGTQAGGNLFHSFQEFSVLNGDTAFFNNAADIQNIISRVTGGSGSNIDGLIRANGNANLFLINPNGIVFGANASLNVGGSFVASTANAVQFGNLGFFSATDKNIPSPLLTINPSALLFNQINQNAAIQNNSVAPAGKDPAGLNTLGLRVPDGKSLLLVGGNVSMNRGRLNANGGRVELGGVSGQGTVGLNVDGNNLNLSFPNGVAKADVFLTNEAIVDVTAEGGGSIAVNARNIDVLGNALGGSSLRAGISLSSETDGAQAGDITLNASEAVRVENSSIYNIVLGSGNGGNLLIDTGKLIVQDGIVATATISQGRAGNLIVKAKDSVELTASNTSNGTVSTKIPVNIFGVSDFSIPAPIGLFSASIDGRSIFSAQNTSNLSPFLNVLLPNLLPTAGGNAGNLTVETGRLIVRDGAVVSPGTTTAGNAGDLTVKADFIELSGTSANDPPLGFEFLRIADRVSSGLRNGTVGSGSGGDLIIETGQLIVRDGAVVGTNTNGSSSAGKLTVNAKESVELSGTSANGFPSLLATATRNTGNANSLTINTKRLRVSNGAIISAATVGGSGQGGELTINATESVELIGTSTTRLPASVFQQAFKVPTAAVFNEGLFPSGVVTGTLGEGDGNNLTINTGRLSIQGGAQASVSTTGAGNAGSLTVRASSIELSGTSVDRPNPNDIVGRSLLTTAVGSDSTGKGGGIDITTNTLSVDRGAAISVSNAGTQDAGSLKITANSIKLDTQGRLAATTASGNGGNITLDVRDFILMRNNSAIATTANKNGSGGNITINSPFIIAVPNENSDIIANAERGDGGRIRINATGIYGLEDRTTLSEDPKISEINASSQFGGDGTVEINTLDIDPNSGLVNLPSVPVDTSVAQGCSAGGSQAQSQFIITGRGGLPPTPSEALNSDAVQVDLVTLNPRIENRSSPSVSRNSPTPDALVEAQGWVMGANGKVVLTANAPTVTPHSSWQSPTDCGAIQSNLKL